MGRAKGYQDMLHLQLPVLSSLMGLPSWFSVILNLYCWQEKGEQEKKSDVLRQSGSLS